MKLPNQAFAAAIAASLVLVTSAAAQSAAGVFRVGHGVSAPALLTKNEPEYSEEARHAGLQGIVRLYIEIDPTGTATNLRVTQSLGMGLDEKAMGSVAQWKFKPGMKDGAPVTVEATIEVHFRLIGLWKIEKTDYLVEDGVFKPEAQAYRLPPKCKMPGSVKIGFDVSTEGVVENVRVIRSDTAELADAILAEVPKWKFQPAMKDSREVRAAVEMELSCEGEAQ